MKWEIPIPLPEKRADRLKAEAAKASPNGDASRDDTGSKAEDVGPTIEDILAFPDDPVPLSPELDKPVGGYSMDFKPRGPDSKPGQVQNPLQE